MDAKELKESLTPQDVEKILDYYNADYFYNPQGVLVANTICHNHHGGSHKLYYYEDGQLFRCYTDCSESFDIYDLIRRVSTVRGSNIEFPEQFPEAFHLVGDIVGKDTRRHEVVKREIGFGDKPERKLINDWEWIERLKRQRTNKPQFNKIDEEVLQDIEFKDWLPMAWIKEDISVETMNSFGIKFYPEINATVIPYRAVETGELIGIRVRNWREADTYGKYTPLNFKGVSYRHPLGYSLYGLYENKDTIERKRKVLIVEGEKSTMKAHTYYKGDSFVVALSGSSMNKYQADLLMKLDVEEVIIGLDRDYLEYGDEEYLRYMNKVRNIAKLFVNKVRTYHLTDYHGEILGHKECVMDRNKEEIAAVFDEYKHLITDLEELEYCAD